MKIAYLLIGLLVVACAAVYSQRGFVVKNPDFPTYQYQIFEVREPAPSLTPATTAPGTAVGTRTTPQVRIPSSSTPPPIQRADRNFEIFCSEMGSRGYRLAQILPGSGAFRAVFEKEIPPIPKK